MKHQENCGAYYQGKGMPELACTCTPIESPEEKCECKKCTTDCRCCGEPRVYCNGDGEVCPKEPCFEAPEENPEQLMCEDDEEARQGAECKGTCEVEENFHSFCEGCKSLIPNKHFDCIRSELAKARQEGRTQLLKEVGEKIEDVEKREFEQWSTKHSEFIRVSDSTKHNILSAVKEILSANK